MAHKRNDASTENNAIQNRFTAYLRVALYNGRVNYFKRRSAGLEYPIEDVSLITESQMNFVIRLAEYDALRQALRVIKERERYILLARVIDEKGFEQIGKEVGLSYKGVATVYYRTLAKLRDLIGRE